MWMMLVCRHEFLNVNGGAAWNLIEVIEKGVLGEEGFARLSWGIF